MMYEKGNEEVLYAKADTSLTILSRTYNRLGLDQSLSGRDRRGMRDEKLLQNTRFSERLM
jgi:hypothetical protein